MTLSVVFIFSVVALHGKLYNRLYAPKEKADRISVIAKVMRKFSA
jgi:hypothetical protein